MIQHLPVRLILAAALALGAGQLRAETAQLSTAQIQRVLAAAVVQAQSLGVPMGVSLVDAGGNLIGFIKMPGAFIHTNHTSFSKAYTAASVRRPNHETGIPPAVIEEIQAATQGRFTDLPGGFPLVVQGQVAGGIGAAGGNAEQDVAVARAGAAALTAKEEKR